MYLDIVFCIHLAMSSTDQDQPVPWSACLQLTKAGAGVAAAVSAGCAPLLLTPAHCAATTSRSCIIGHEFFLRLIQTPQQLQQTMALATLCDMYHVPM